MSAPKGIRKLAAWGAALAASALCLSACTSRAPSSLAAVPTQIIDGRPAILFVHGFYGSHLRERGNGPRVFYSVWEALFGDRALSLYQSELGTPRGPELEVEGLMGTVPVVPGLYENDVYSSFIRGLRQSYPGSQVLPVVYDWREDLYPVVHRLDELVKLLKEKNCPSITLMAHSLGGQVVTFYLGYGTRPLETAKLDWSGASQVQSAVFFGTPFLGSMIAFRSFEKGLGPPKAQRMLPADTMSSFPSMFQLLPASSLGLLDFQGKPLGLDLFDANTWKKHHFGLLRRRDLSAGFLEAREKFVADRLARAHRWSELIQLRAHGGLVAPAPFKVLNVVGTGRDTLDGAYLNPESGAVLTDLEELTAAKLSQAPLFRSGDQTVTTLSAGVPAALESVTKVIMTNAPTTNFFLDPAVETEYKTFLAK